MGRLGPKDDTSDTDQTRYSDEVRDIQHYQTLIATPNYWLSWPELHLLATMHPTHRVVTYDRQMQKFWLFHPIPTTVTDFEARVQAGDTKHTAPFGR